MEPIVYGRSADEPADAARSRAAHAEQRDDIAIIGVHALGAAGVIAARLGLDVADIDDMAEQFALIGLRAQPADMRGDPGIDARQIGERVALARQAAQQQKAAAEAHFLAAPGEIAAEPRQRKALRRDLRKVDLAERMEVAQRRVDLIDLGGGEDANALLPEMDPRAFPDGRTFDRGDGHSVSPPSTMTVWPVTIAAPAHRKKM